MVRLTRLVMVLFLGFSLLPTSGSWVFSSLGSPLAHACKGKKSCPRHKGKAGKTCKCGKKDCKECKHCHHKDKGHDADTTVTESSTQTSATTSTETATKSE